jgi:transcriptional regulator with XRE-family HTH domain
LFFDLKPVITGIMKELKELGARVRHQRVAQGLKQQELAAKAAVSEDVLSALENGRSVTVESLARVLQGLGLREALINLLPPPVPSPIALQKLAGKERQRVR